MKPFLLEIGCEEIPARFVTRGAEILRDEIVKLLEKSSIEYGKISEYATPRRLAIYVDEVSESQKDKIIEALGPPKKAAFDNNGAPTRAAAGFAKSLNIDVSSLRVITTERGEYVAATVEEKGKPAIEVLAGALPKLISSLPLPKSMRWGDGTLRFFRPVQWILALFGNEVVRFELDGIKSGNTSYGHRFLSPNGITIKAPSEYPSLLLENSVVAGFAERKKFIANEIKNTGVENNCIVHEDDELLDTVTNLVEYPAVIMARFDDKFITLPKELLITVMRTHQKYFSTEDESGNILPSFVVVSNTKAENSATVKKGAERVLRARLEDARFYFDEDRKIPLFDYVEKLKQVTFQDKLGSLFVKVERISALCSFIANELNIVQKDKLLRAAMLCKADLVTGIVREFPELQGYMGMMYALDSGEDKETATAIFEHYLPKFAGDSVPEGETGSIISIADKMDNITSFFSLGMIPSGSEDPYALRRQAAGVISILQSKNYPLSLNLLLEKALQPLEPSKNKREALLSNILNFFQQRLEGIFQSQGYAYDIITAALTTGELTIKKIAQRIETITELKKSPKFPALLLAAKRVYNILAKVQAGDVKEDLLNEQVEKDLLKSVKNAENKLSTGKFDVLFELEKPINAFFDSVLVMDKDEKVKSNRLALLCSVKKVFDTVGDFSKIVE